MGSWNKVLGPVIWRGPGPELLSRGSFTVGATKCGRGQDRGAGQCGQSYPLIARGGRCGRLAHLLPGPACSQVTWESGVVTWQFPIPRGQGEEGERLEPGLLLDQRGREGGPPLPFASPELVLPCREKEPW